MKQNYKAYTGEDHDVWKILFDRQIPTLKKVATDPFLVGLDKIDFKSEKIPDFSKANKILKKTTGWQITAVPGIVEDHIFFDLLANKNFPATTWVRKRHQLDYLEEPDMFHDVFAHIPLLTNEAYVSFLQALSKLGQRWINDDWAIHLLSRIYWYTIEFGLIYENDTLKIYGAGILSSQGETAHAISSKPIHHKYDVHKILDSTYRKDVMQEQYFIIDSYDQLYESMPLIKTSIEMKLQERTGLFI